MTDELLLINNNFSLYKTLRYNLSLSHHRLLPPNKRGWHLRNNLFKVRTKSVTLV